MVAGSQEVLCRNLPGNMGKRCEESRSMDTVIIAVNGATGRGIAQISARNEARQQEARHP